MFSRVPLTITANLLMRWKLMNTNFGIEPKMNRSWIHTVGNVDGVHTERIGNVVYGGGGGDYEGVGGIIGGGFWKRGGDGGSGKEVVVVALLQKGECMRNTIMVNNVIFED
ncbi:unnamed protein product [Malus baccata var. baccata]